MDQVLSVERWRRNHLVESGEYTEETLPKGQTLVNNLVIMGMGEPLANCHNLTQSLHILNAPWGMNIGARKITVSTSGLVPQIRMSWRSRSSITWHRCTGPQMRCAARSCRSTGSIRWRRYSPRVKPINRPRAG